MWENAKNILCRQIFRFIFHYNYFYKPVLMTSSCKKFPVAVWTDRDLHQIALRVPGWMCLPCIVASQQDVVRAWTGKRREWRAAFVRKAVFRVGKSRGKMGNAKGGEKSHWFNEGHCCRSCRVVHEEINGAHICRQELDIDKKKRRLYTIEWSYFLLGQNFTATADGHEL